MVGSVFHQTKMTKAEFQEITAQPISPHPSKVAGETTVYKLTQCVAGWQWGACGLRGVERLPPRIKAVPNDETWSGYVHGKSPWARSCSNIGISSARCSSAIISWLQEINDEGGKLKKRFFKFLSLRSFKGPWKMDHLIEGTRNWPATKRMLY